MTEQATPTTEQPQTNFSALAKNLFGDSFHGEVKEPQQTPADPPPNPEVTQPDPDAQPPDPAQNAEVDEVPVTSLYELAEKFELDAEWLDTLELPVKINGAEGKAKLADLKKSYQIEQAAVQRLEEAKAKARAETQAITERRNQLEAQFTVAANVITEAEKLLGKDFSSIDWNKLRETDPAEFSAKKTELAERQAHINSLKQNAIAAYQQSAQKQAEEQRAIHQQFLQEQQTLLMTKLPEWKDAKVASAEKQQIAQYLVDQGFTNEDIASASDHRMILLARKAMLFDKGQDKAEVVKKKVLTIPKVMKPGAPKSPEQNKQAHKNEARARLRKSGSLEDALAYLRS